MKNVKNFTSWVNEDFAAVGVAPEGNVTGMGNVVPPGGAGAKGSGDAWPSLGSPSTQKAAKICPDCKNPEDKCTCDKPTKEDFRKKKALRELNEDDPSEGYLIGYSFIPLGEDNMYKLTGGGFKNVFPIRVRIKWKEGKSYPIDARE